MSKQNPYRARIRKVITALTRQDVSSALIVSSATEKEMSRDVTHPFLQDSELLYLTGSERKGTLLFVDGRDKEVLLVGRAVSELEKLWEGPQPSLRSIAKFIGAKAIETDDPLQWALHRVTRLKQLFFGHASGSLSHLLVQRILEKQRPQRFIFPSRLVSSDELLTPLREIKSRDEISTMTEAIKCSHEALEASLPFLTPKLSEIQFAKRLEAEMATRGGEPAFRTIVASDVNAAVLHHSPGTGKLRRGALVLIDYGAMIDHYCADITRVFPVDGTFSSDQAKVYDIVHQALEDSIAAIKPGVKLRSVQQACEKSIARGLSKARIIKKPVSSILRTKAHRVYFPHSVSHGLGLDTHDPLSRGLDTVLAPNMVLTVEPGVYTQARILGMQRGIGIRLEQDVQVTNTGSRVLSKAIPIERSDIEAMLRNL